MFSSLSEYNIDLAEKAILSTKLVNDISPCISCRDYELAHKSWKLINKTDTPCTSYILFASNAFGFTSFGFYKAKNGNVYIIEAYINEIQKIYIPNENMSFLLEA